MGNIIRLSNGGSIQVRTGILSGVGPQGPRGQIGPQGPDGPAGPRGDTGPIGQILQMMSKASITAPFAVTPGADSFVPWNAVAYDDMSIFSSGTNMVLVEKSDYLFSCYICFELPANAVEGYRQVKFTSSTNGLIAIQQLPPVSGAPTYVNLTFPYRAQSNNEVIRVAVTHTDDVNLNVSGGVCTVNRIGSGPRGEQGVQGPQGLTGAQGPQGPQGPAGNAGSGFLTYADLL